MTRTNDLERIGTALQLAVEALHPFTAGEIDHQLKEGGDPVTAADEAVNAVLAGFLPVSGEGWLSDSGLQAGQGRSGPRTGDMDAGSQARVGCRRRCSLGDRRRRRGHQPGRDDSRLQSPGPQVERLRRLRARRRGRRSRHHRHRGLLVVEMIDMHRSAGS